MGHYCSWFRYYFKNRNDYLRCPEEYAKELTETTRLTSGQIQHLYHRFCIISNYDPLVDKAPPKRLMKRNFLSLARFSRNPLFSNILNDMFGERKVLSFIEFATYLSLFQGHTLKTKQTVKDEKRDKKYRLLFNLYDTDKDGCITQADLIKVIHKLLHDFIHSFEILKIVEIMFEEMDSTNSHKILFADFCAALAVFDMDETLVTNIPEA